MRALITGASGQLGSDLRQVLPAAAGYSRTELDVTDRAAVARAIRAAQAEVVFNCAADSAVDAAEEDPTRADSINGAAPGLLAQVCRAEGVQLVHFSTNYVFDGTGPGAYSEEDPVSPLGAYARSKVEGERRVLEELPSALVIRSSGLFGAVGSAVKGGSFPQRLVGWAREGRSLRVVDDQTLNPTFTGDLAAASAKLAEQGMTGIVHVVAAGCCSYWDLAREALVLAGLGHLPVERVDSGAFPAAAPRPLNGCLRSVRVPPLRPWQDGLAEWWSEFSARV